MTEPEPPTQTRVGIHVSYHQYQLQTDPERWDEFPASPDGLLTGEDNWLAVITGVEVGTVDVTLQPLPEAPHGPAAGYEISAERDLDAASGRLELRAIMDPQPAHAITITAGRYRVRVSATGRWEASTRPDGAEQHLVQVWPSPGPQEPALLTGPDRYARAYLGQPTE